MTALSRITKNRLMSIEKALQYDKRLKFVKHLDGTKRLVRESPYNTLVEFDVIELKNEFVGSGRWLRDKLISMDTQRKDIVARVRENNLKIRNRKDSFRAHREIADMFAGGGDTFVN